jgi:hypothetical protein
VKRARHNGNSGGTLSKLREEFVASLQTSYEQHGRAAIERVCEEDPVVYVRIIASVALKQLKPEHNPLDELNADEIDRRILSFQALIDDRG